MKTILAARAATILYELLVRRNDQRRFLLPANICPIVPITFFKAGVPIEFVDIRGDTLNMDMGEAEARLLQWPRDYGGVLYAHTYGDPSTPDESLSGLKKRFPELLLIDDRCLCVPDLEPREDSAADVILYSTGYAKIVDIGFGGYAFMKDEVPYASRPMPFRQDDLVALEADYRACIEAGRPYRYKDSDWLQTETDLPGWADYRQQVQAGLTTSLGHRQEINAVYNSRIPSQAQLPQQFQLWRFNTRVPDKRRVQEAIFGAGLFASSHYASLDGIMGAGGGSNASQLAGQVINLFNDHHYTLEMAEKTADIVRRSL